MHIATKLDLKVVLQVTILLVSIKYVNLSISDL